MDSDRLHEIQSHPGSYVGYLSDALVQDNTKDPITGKDMLMSYGQYNVGVTFVRFIQLYTLALRDPIRYNFRIRSNVGPVFSVVNDPTYIKIDLTNNEGGSVEDLPKEVRIYTKANRIGDNIELIWDGRDDKLRILKLNENTGVISAYFFGNGKIIIKSSDGRVEYVRVSHIFGEASYRKHRSQEEGPAVITADGNREYWNDGKHIRTEYPGRNVKRAR